MATSTDPLRRDQIGVVANLPTSRVSAPESNAALQLAQSLREISPEARVAMDALAKDRAGKAREEAKRQAIQNSGAKLADATREGKIKKTQNPWFIQAYNRESAAIRATTSLQQLQVESASWDEVDDPQAFAKRWREAVGKVSEDFVGEDHAAGFNAAEAAVSSQVLQTNVAKNSARIVTERQANLSALASDALQSALRARGGALTPNEAWEALAPARQQWLATGGSVEEWDKIVIGAVTTTAYSTQDKTLLDLLRAPELNHGPSEFGASGKVGSGQGYEGATVYPGEPAPAPEGGKPPATDPALASAPKPSSAPARVVSPERKGFSSLPIQGGITSGFGQRKAPKVGASTYHKGIDIGAPQGTTVAAQATGKVVFAGYEKGLGNVVRIDYGGGVISEYGHLSAIHTQAGAVVSSGQKLGAVGSTGVSTGPHLHWGISTNGKWGRAGQYVDPKTFAGQIGGTFEGGPSEPPPAPESLSGFPGQDKPFSPSGSIPPNHYSRGPSLYGQLGVADQVEADRYRIGEAAMASISENMRKIDAARTARGYAGQDFLLNKYGTGVLTGAVTRGTMIEDLHAQGYSGAEIAKALNFVHSSLSDSVGVANAQVAARGQAPGMAKYILDLQVEGAQAGYSDGYRDKVGALVLSGTLSRDDAAGMVGSALSRSRQQESEAKADQREARAEARYQESQKLVSSWADLREQAQVQAGFVITQALKLRPDHAIQLQDQKMRDFYTRAITDAMGAWLTAHPKDFDGAMAAGQARAAELLGTFRSAPPASVAAPPAAGGNPRRN